MSLIEDLANRRGVVAAGNYAYRGDQYAYAGRLSNHQARSASVMCRAHSQAVSRELEMLEMVCERCGLNPWQGWFVRGPRITVCVIANVFCFMDNETADINGTIGMMRERLADARNELV